MLKPQKRHQSPCTRPEWDQRSCVGKGANCPILIIGTLNGKRVRLSTAGYLPPEKARDMQAARDLAILWEQAGAPVRAEEFAPAPTTANEPEAPIPTVEMAVAAYLADSRDRGNGDAAMEKKTAVFQRTSIVNP